MDAAHDPHIDEGAAAFTDDRSFVWGE